MPYGFNRYYHAKIRIFSHTRKKYARYVLAYAGTGIGKRKF